MSARPSGLARTAGMAAEDRLAIMGAFHPGPDDRAPPGTGTLILLGPDGPDFWDHVTAAPEFADGRPDPLDRWSRRVIGRMAARLGGVARYPFGGPPWAPFHIWAVRGGRAWPSPVGLLVHETAGLWLSFRGALALRDRLTLPPASPRSPCEDCADRPCLTACPVGALGAAGFDVPACHAYLDTDPGADCLQGGCAVRRACPVSAAHGRDPAQSAYHMRQVHGGRP